MSQDGGQVRRAVRRRHHACTCFVTTMEVRPTLERQRDDAPAKGQVAREQILDGLLARLDEQAG
ncbi:hypothetical protein ABZW30_46760 [Kitasatospora sp. NPDC004669]|uniref:hypothetical protein n=1 Tax=Kitasatospora sp. NPDC004669 TaxID=3154555 RepID=UPI0033BF27B5